jgi:hypothetical protein
MAREVNKMQTIIEKAKKDFERSFKEIINLTDKLLDEGVNAKAIYLALVTAKTIYEVGLKLSGSEKEMAIKYAKELISEAMGMRQ